MLYDTEFGKIWAESQEEADAWVLTQHRINARKALKIERDFIISQPINNVQLATIEDREKIQGAVEYFDDVSTDGVKLWIMSDNSIGYLSESDMAGLIPAYIMRVDKAFTAFAIACGALELATREEEINLIKVDDYYDEDQ